MQNIQKNHFYFLPFKIIFKNSSFLSKCLCCFIYLFWCLLKLLFLLHAEPWQWPSFFLLEWDACFWSGHPRNLFPQQPVLQGSFHWPGRLDPGFSRTLASLGSHVVSASSNTDGCQLLGLTSVDFWPWPFLFGSSIDVEKPCYMCVACVRTHTNTHTHTRPALGGNPGFLLRALLICLGVGSGCVHLPPLSTYLNKGFGGTPSLPLNLTTSIQFSWDNCKNVYNLILKYNF